MKLIREKEPSTIYVILEERQNDHGFVDTSVLESFEDPIAAEEQAKGFEDQAIDEGERVEGRNDEGDDWTVCYKVTETKLFRNLVIS